MVAWSGALKSDSESDFKFVKSLKPTLSPSARQRTPTHNLTELASLEVLLIVIMSASETMMTNVPSYNSASPYSENKMEASATASTAGDTILGRKLKKILESDLETDSETAHALEELSTFFTDNTLHTRRFLRGEIERRSLQGCWWIPINSLYTYALAFLCTGLSKG